MVWGFRIAVCREVRRAGSRGVVGARGMRKRVVVVLVLAGIVMGEVGLAVGG